ncbi:MAG: ABC transporter permease [Lysobacteraceae bacterium]|nr:MAG: ABC transporter permease [Xanthomonadaceae bacterium]
MIDGPFSALGKYRHLTLEVTKREVLGRYRGATFGLLWSLINPFLMLIVYTVAFGYILKSRWPGYSGGTTEFALILYMGLIVHGAFAECLVRASGLVPQNANLVTRVVFPLHILPWTVVLSALFHMLANAVIFLLLSFIVRGYVPWTVVMLPLVWAPLIVLATGVSLFLAALGAYMRDVGQVMGAVAAAMLFLSSAIVPVSTLPEHYRIIFMMNPLTFIIDQSREVAYFGRMPDWTGLLIYLGIALVVAYAGHAIFQKARRGFADVL